MQSMIIWQGKTENNREFRLVLKEGKLIMESAISIAAMGEIVWVQENNVFAYEKAILALWDRRISSCK